MFEWLKRGSVSLDEEGECNVGADTSGTNCVFVLCFKQSLVGLQLTKQAPGIPGYDTNKPINEPDYLIIDTEFYQCLWL